MNEFELIASLTEDAPRRVKDLVCGVGDDCAVIEAGGKVWLVTTDALIEDVHFKSAWTDLTTLGRKALAVNLSDIAAMGGLPRFYLVSIGLPKNGAGSIAKKIYSGMKEMAALHNVILIGGDTVASNDGIVISITAIGESKRDECIFRAGAKEGDAIYVTGTVGSSALGLECLKAGFKSDAAEYFVERHLNPNPRIAEGRFLAGLKMISAMIDVSDGVALDLAHIADSSGVGFEINADLLPRNKNFEVIAEELNLDPVKTQLAGGEDYELLFTVAAKHAAKFEDLKKKCPSGCRITRIGTMKGSLQNRRAQGGEKKDVLPEKRGFDHFG